MMTVSWENYILSFVTERLSSQCDASHDIFHNYRVIENIRNIINHPTHPIKEDVDMDVLIAAAFLHDIDMTPKDSPERAKSSTIAADMASDILDTLPPYVKPFPKEKIALVKEAIQMHSFSYEQTLPEEKRAQMSLEAKILQDADRLDALGVAGVARMFYVAGKTGVPHFHAGVTNPNYEYSPNDTQCVADHYAIKLSRLPGLMKTEAGRVMAEERAKYIAEFLDTLEEIKVIIQDKGESV